MKYPGSKGGAGVYQTIINQIPPHRVYIETHLGGGNVFERKAPAQVSFGIDVDQEVIHRWMGKGLQLYWGDAVNWLNRREWAGDEFVYCDPPYVMSARRGGKLYRHEYTDADHVRLLDVLARLPCAVMLSGYRSELYAQSPIASWRTIDFPAMTRRGPATETIWMNYPAPVKLHDPQYLGTTFRERERIKRKKQRWLKRFEKLDLVELGAIMECVQGLYKNRLGQDRHK